MATKEQERKALEQIKKIIDGLGENSYIGMAFEGCIDDAAENIEMDFGCSMKQRYEEAKANAEYFQKLASDLDNENERMESELQELRKKVLTQDEHQAVVYALSQRVEDLKAAMASDAENIVAWADTPQDIAFKDAVEQHRRHQRERQSMEAVLDSILYK